jgi:hypothetical protein
MRLFLISLAAFGLLAGPIAAVAQPTPAAMAPADEYFGRTSESVLEIRNRLSVLDQKSDLDIKSADALGAMDNVEEAILDWQHKYPSDPWVTDAMARLLEAYARAGAAEDPHASAVMQLLAAGYPHAPETGEALLAVADATMPDDPAPSNAVVSGAVVDAITGAPVVDAIVIVAPNHESNDVVSSPFATTASDGSFEVANVPLGAAYSAGPVTMEHAEYIVVEPPLGSVYAPYHGVIDVNGGQAQAGVIRLAAR